ncbi:MAG TPA: hypothetical protein VNU48_06860 [Burkholderiaceae bacterium]|nr:hypothetical protein [Burkholderiaceae bacterium]
MRLDRPQGPGARRTILDGLILRFGSQALDEAERGQLNRVWHRLDPGPTRSRG